MNDFEWSGQLGFRRNFGDGVDMSGKSKRKRGQMKVTALEVNLNSGSHRAQANPARLDMALIFHI